MSWVGHAICIWAILNMVVLAVLVAEAETESKRNGDYVE